jgi:hypothetical protein
VPVTVAEAQTYGWTRAARRHAVAAGDLADLGRGVVGPCLDADIAAHHAQRLALLRAARRSAARCPRTVLSHFPAAIAQGIPTFGPLEAPCLTVPSGTALRRLTDAHLHRAGLAPQEIVRLDSEVLTCPARTVMDIAREHGVPAGVVAADYVLHEGLCSRADLAAAYELCATWPGRRSARSTLLSADGAAESPLESLSRLKIATAGLPPPQLQAEICDLDGCYITRSDFLWDEYGVVGEADGALKYAADDGATVARERGTQAKLETLGLLIVRWGWRDVFDFDGVVRRLEWAIERGARRGSRRRGWGVLVPNPRLHP